MEITYQTEFCNRRLMQENGALDSKKNKADCYNRLRATAAKNIIERRGDVLHFWDGQAKTVQLIGKSLWTDLSDPVVIKI